MARSLFLYGLCNGRIRRGQPIIEASSGSTAISEAYFAQLLGLPFIALVPESTATEKIAEIAEAGESGSLVSMICDPGERYLHSHYSDEWIAQQGLDIAPYLEQLQSFQQTGTMAALRT